VPHSVPGEKKENSEEKKKLRFRKRKGRNNEGRNPARKKGGGTPWVAVSNGTKINSPHKRTPGARTRTNHGGKKGEYKVEECLLVTRGGKGFSRKNLEPARARGEDGW